MAGLSPDERELLGEVIEGRADLERLAHDLDAGRTLSPHEANLLRDAVGSEIAVDPGTGDIDERGIRLDHLIDRIAQVSGMWRA